MTHADIEDLRARIKAALAASAEEHGRARHPKDAPDRHVVPFDAMACHLVNHDDTRAVLTDPAVKALGGREHAVEISPTRDEIVITVKEEEVHHHEAKEAE
jgi:hypothetical protein